MPFKSLLNIVNVVVPDPKFFFASAEDAAAVNPIRIKTFQLMA